MKYRLNKRTFFTLKLFSRVLTDCRHMAWKEIDTFRLFLSWLYQNILVKRCRKRKSFAPSEKSIMLERSIKQSARSKTFRTISFTPEANFRMNKRNKSKSRIGKVIRTPCKFFIILFVVSIYIMKECTKNMFTSQKWFHQKYDML